MGYCSKALVLAALFASANAQAFKGISPTESLLKQSEDLNEWTDASKVGSIIGFAVFFLMYIVTIGMIFFDISWTSREYDQEIQKDRAKMTELGMDKKMPELEAELALRLSGKKDDDAVDDQLMGEAQKLDRSAFAKYM